MRAAASGSSDRVGSSSKSTGGRDNIARATANLCLFPVDISPNRRRATSSNSSLRKQFSNTFFRHAIAESMKPREEHQILFPCETPVKTALFSSRQSDFAAHLFVISYAVVASD